MTSRRQHESLVLGFVFGAILSFVLTLSASLLPWFDAEPETRAASAPVTTVVVEEPASTNGGGTMRGQGPPEGRGPGSQANAEATADPMSFGTASQDVLDAFASGGCVACHSIKGVGGGAATVGPHLFRLGVIAADRRPGDSVKAYIEESILHPNAFIMPNCPAGPCTEGLMPQNYADTLSASDLATIVDYLSVLGTAAEADVLAPPAG